MEEESDISIECKDFFIQRYTDRIKTFTNTDIDIETFEPLEYLLVDEEFYWGLFYATNSPPEKRQRHAGTVLWEVLGMQPRDYAVLCDMLVHPQLPTDEEFTAVWSSSGMSPKQYWDKLESLPTMMCVRVIRDALADYYEDLECNKKEKFWNMAPLSNGGRYPLLQGLILYMKEQLAKMRRDGNERIVFPKDQANIDWKEDPIDLSIGIEKWTGDARALESEDNQHPNHLADKRDRFCNLISTISTMNLQ